MKDNKYKPIHYSSYLQLDKLLSAQGLRTEELSNTPAHEEMLFIITHQAYELWFKQIIHELASVHQMFASHVVDERNLGIAVARLTRVSEIMELLIKQIGIMETMTPLDFLDFRGYLFPASGFQSYQFRVVETLLGLREEQRITYNNMSYKLEFSQEQQDYLTSIENGASLFDTIEDWLERTPFLQFGDFEFVEQYKASVENMLGQEMSAIKAAGLPPEQEAMRLRMLGGMDSYFQMIFDPSVHDQLRSEGKMRMTYEATLAALLIRIYRDEPILQMPFNLLSCLTTLDEQLVTWRYRHSQMVLRMLGRKIGTGGSSGYDYLQQTAAKHHIFGDLHMISTLLIPRSEIPELPSELRKALGFYFSSSEQA